MQRLNIFKGNSVVRKGFLLPDVMIAVFVVAGALVAILSVMAPTIKAEFFKRDQMIATGLAQEGIEVMRNIRDNNWKGNINAFDGNFPVPGDYCINYDDSPTVAGCSSNNGYLTQDIATGIYRSNSTGKFKRTVEVSVSGTSRDITSTVTWGTAPSVHEITLTDTLTNWGDKQ
jgi:Tfp pilus assembly protein PilV